MTRAFVLVVALASSGCASALVAAEGAIHRTIAVTQDTAIGVCDAKLKSEEECRAFNAKLVPTIVGARQFNRAVRENSAAEVPAMLAALLSLRDAVVAFFPPGFVESVQARVESTWTLVSGLKR